MLLISFITTKFCSSRLKFYKVDSKESKQRLIKEVNFPTDISFQRQDEQTHMGFGPENKDFSNHSEKFFCIWIRAGQPPRSVAEQDKME